MQRRVATIYFVFFLVMGASAFSVIAVADAPQMELSGPELAQGDSFEIGKQTYTVSTIEVEEGSHGSGATVVGELTWTNESAQYSQTVANNTTLSPVRFAFDGQEARYTATLEDGETVQFNGSEATVELNVSGGNFALVRGDNVTATVAINDSFAYQGNTTTVYAVEESGATLVWGEPYTLYIGDDNNTARAVQQFNVSQRLAADPAVENQTVTLEDGNRYVVFTANGSTQPLSEYLPAPDTAAFGEGDTVTYSRSEATITNISASGVQFEWTAPRQKAADLEQGNNVTLNGQQYVVHFPDERHVQISIDVGEYQQTVREQDGFKSRMNGLWGVTILSGIAGFMIIGMAFLPVKD